MVMIPKVYALWSCPYAQRALIAMHAKKVEFEYIEQDPANKSPEWMSISPTGLVPVIVHGGDTIYESAICIEYVDEAFQTGVSLLPKDPYQRAHARIWGDFIGKKIIPYNFAFLLKQSKEEQDEAKGKLLEGLKTFIQAMSSNHPYFQGDTLGYVDIMFAPFAQRMMMLKHFCGFDIPETPEFERYHKWWATVKKHPAVAATIYEDEKLITKFAKYIEKKRSQQASK